VLSHGYWQRRFGGDPAIVGKAVTAGDGTPPTTVLGVMPADFVCPYKSMLGPSGFTRALSADIWMPLTMGSSRMVDASGQPTRQVHFLTVIARLKAGADLAAARADLSAIAAHRATAFPDSNDGWGVTVRPLHDQTVGAIRPALILLLVGVGIVLLMTCINVANVLLARGTARRRDVAIRTALGASRRRLAVKTLVESGLLSLAGGIAAIGICLACTYVLVALAPTDLPRIAEVRASGPVLLFTLALSLVTGLLVGALPALGVARGGTPADLRETHRTTASPARRRVRATLVVAEVALATALTVGAGLLLRSFVAVLGVDPGFNAENLLTFQMNLPARLTTNEALLAFYGDLESRLRALPGVTQVGGTTRLPLGSTNVSTSIAVDGRDLPVAQLPEAELRRAVFDFFSTMGIPTVRGRTFEPTDDLAAPRVAVVNAAFVARVFPGDDPIGRRVRIGPNPSAVPLTIVGVVGNVRHGSLEETPRPEIYLSYRQGPPIAPFLMLRTTGDPGRLAAQVREVVTSLGAHPPYALKPMIEVRSEAVASRRFLLILVAVFGTLALTLAALGVYGVMSLVVSERTAEVGVRLALGARPGQVCAAVIGDAVRLSAAGVGVGLLLGLGLATFAAHQLFGVGPADPLTLAGVTTVLLAAATAAALVPARRAMRTDPIEALRG
jgi:putative ABC transport system permease protein